MKFHDLPSEKPENTNTNTEKSKQNLEFHILEMSGNFSFIQAFSKLRVISVSAGSFAPRGVDGV